MRRGIAVCAGGGGGQVASRVVGDAGGGVGLGQGGAGIAHGGESIRVVEQGGDGGQQLSVIGFISDNEGGAAVGQVGGVGVLVVAGDGKGDEDGGQGQGGEFAQGGGASAGDNEIGRVQGGDHVIVQVGEGAVACCWAGD